MMERGANKSKMKYSPPRQSRRSWQLIYICKVLWSEKMEKNLFLSFAESFSLSSLVSRAPIPALRVLSISGFSSYIFICLSDFPLDASLFSCASSFFPIPAVFLRLYAFNKNGDGKKKTEIQMKMWKMGGWEKNPEIQMKLRSSGKNWIQRGKGWRRKVDKERGGKEGKGTSRRLVTVTVTEPSGTIAS